jgi:hypothetical protein
MIARRGPGAGEARRHRLSFARPYSTRPQARRRLGTLFAKELPPEASGYFAAIVERYGVSPGLARVMRLIPPGAISAADLVALFPTPRFELLSTGTSRIRTVNTLPNGEVINVPAIYVVVRPVTEGDTDGRAAAHNRP